MRKNKSVRHLSLALIFCLCGTSAVSTGAMFNLDLNSEKEEKHDNNELKRQEFAAALPPGQVSARVLAQHATGLGHAACAHRFLHRCIHRVELMVARGDLVQRARVRRSKSGAVAFKFSWPAYSGNSQSCFRQRTGELNKSCLSRDVIPE